MEQPSTDKSPEPRKLDKPLAEGCVLAADALSQMMAVGVLTSVGIPIQEAKIAARQMKMNTDELRRLARIVQNVSGVDEVLAAARSAVEASDVASEMGQEGPPEPLPRTRELARLRGALRAFVGDAEGRLKQISRDKPRIVTP